MDLWIAKRQGESFVGIERVPLDGFEDLFETDLAQTGSLLTFVLPEAGQRLEMKGFVLPSPSQLKRSGRLSQVAERVRAGLGDLDRALERNLDSMKPSQTAMVSGQIGVMDALLRARRPLSAVVVHS